MPGSSVNGAVRARSCAQRLCFACARAGDPPAHFQFREYFEYLVDGSETARITSGILMLSALSIW